MTRNERRAGQGNPEQENTMSGKVRRRPCLTCPYRRDVPSGIWTADEYAKLAAYDRPTGEQPLNVFGCHQADGYICAGWAGCHDMSNSLSARLAVTRGEADPAIYGYRSPVPLFASGAEAAEHGLRDVRQPGKEAKRAMSHLITVRKRRQP